MKRTRSDPEKAKWFYGYVVVFASFSIFVVVYGVHYAFGVFLKPMLAEFGWGRALISGAFSLSWLMQGASSVILGRVNDRYGPRIVLTISAILISSGFFLTPMVTAAWQLYLFYGVLIGLGGGGVFVPLVSTISRWFVVGRNTITGVAVSGIGLGTFLLSPLANHLIDLYTWRTSYRMLGLGILLVMVAAAQFLRRDPEKTGQLPHGSLENRLPFPRNEPPGSSLEEAFVTREFWLVFAMFFCFGFCFSAVMAHIAPHATDIGKSSAMAANLVAAIGIASIAGKILLGALGDRIGNKSVFILCYLLMAASLLLLNHVRDTWLLLLFAVGFGLAYGGSGTSQGPLIASLFGLKSHGLIMGVIINGFTIGAAFGPVVAGWLFDVTGTYHTAFSTLFAVAFLALMLTVAIRQKPGAVFHR